MPPETTDPSLPLRTNCGSTSLRATGGRRPNREAGARRAKPAQGPHLSGWPPLPQRQSGGGGGPRSPAHSWRSSQAAARVSRVPASTRQVVLLLGREGGRLVTSLDVAVEDRPTGKSSKRSSWRLLDHKSDSAGALAARRESRDRQAPSWPEVGAGVAPEFMPKRNSGPICRRGPMGDDAALSRLASSGDAATTGRQTRNAVSPVFGAESTAWAPCDGPPISRRFGGCRFAMKRQPREAPLRLGFGPEGVGGD